MEKSWPEDYTCDRLQMEQSHPKTSVVDTGQSASGGTPCSCMRHTVHDGCACSTRTLFTIDPLQRYFCFKMKGLATGNVILRGLGSQKFLVAQQKCCLNVGRNSSWYPAVLCTAAHSICAGAAVRVTRVTNQFQPKVK